LASLAHLHAPRQWFWITNDLTKEKRYSFILRADPDAKRVQNTARLLKEKQRNGGCETYPVNLISASDMQFQ